MSLVNPETIVLALLPACPYAERTRLPQEPGVYFICEPKPSGPQPVYIGETSRSIRTRAAQHHIWIERRAIQAPLVLWLTPDDEAFPYDDEDRVLLERQLIRYWWPWMNVRDNPSPGW